MSNMSYCRFENTERDVCDCKNAVLEAIENGEPLEDFVGQMSEHERRAFNRFAKLCQEVADLLEDYQKSE